MPHPSRRAEFAAGVRAQLPLLLGVAPFGMAYGAYAIDTGLSVPYALAMSVVIFGGASQFVAAQQLDAAVPGVMIVLTVGLVNLRHALYSASLAPHVGHLAAPWRWLFAYLLTDEAYAMAISRYRQPDDAPHRHWFVLGTMLALWSCWQATTAAGVALGASVPESWALEFALPLTFIAILVPVLKDRPALAAAGAAGLVAVLGHGWPYGTGLITAALAGIAVGMAAGVATGAPGAHPSDEARA